MEKLGKPLIRSFPRADQFGKLVLLLPGLLSAQPADLLRKPQRFERSRDYDAIHYKLQFRFDVANKSYLGENTVTLLPLTDDFRRCVLDAEDFTVTEVTGASGKTLRFSQSEQQLTVEFAEPRAYGQRTAFTVKFFQKDPKTGLKFIDAAPDHPAQINTYSWPEDAHHWFPCYDFPNDKVTDELIATVPGTYKVLSNGWLVAVTEDKGLGTKTYHWSQELPHPAYGIMLAAGPYEVITDSLGKLPVDYWVYPKDVPDAPRSFKKTPKMIEFYEKTFGFPYPWAKYDQVCVAGYGGSMEATTATILGDSTIHDERADRDFSSEGLVAHELAHMWWGDLITERTWADVWLSESFATYSECLFSGFDKGEDEGALNLEEKKASYLSEAHTRYIRPIVFDHYDHPWDIMDGHSYPKGAAVLHMLRFVMGDAPFFRTIHHFLEKHAYGVADTHDLMTAVKEATGQNMDWFFAQWVFKPGHPVFEVSSVWDAASGKLRLKVVQVQDLTKGVPIYVTSVVIGITTSGKHVSEKVWVRDKFEEFEFSISEKPLLVTFDEGNFLLKEMTFGKPADEFVYELRNGDVIARMRAASGLTGSGEGPAVAALAESARRDPFRGVRRAAIAALERMTDKAIRGVLEEKCQAADPGVREAAVSALGDPKHRMSAAFFRKIFGKDTSYVVQAAALKSLGSCGGASDFPFLEKASRLRSPWNVLKQSAEQAIQLIRSKKD